MQLPDRPRESSRYQPPQPHPRKKTAHRERGHQPGELELKHPLQSHPHEYSGLIDGSFWGGSISLRSMSTFPGAPHLPIRGSIKAT